MNNEGFEEEWDADFLDKLIQVEELALSSTTNPPTQHHHPPQLQFIPPPSAASSSTISYSPPRALSQRFQQNSVNRSDQSSNATTAQSTYAIPPVLHKPAAPNAREQELDSLKRELERVLKQRNHLEQVCSDLRKDIEKKAEELRYVQSRLEAKDVEVHGTKSTDFSHDGGEYGVHNQNYSAAFPGCQNTNSIHHPVGLQINVGVQTEEDVTRSDLSTSHQLSRKLLGIWESKFDQRTERNLVAKLFVACEMDFQVLFEFLGSNLPSKTMMDSLGKEYSSDVSLQSSTQQHHSVEAAKVSHLYSMLTKISNGLVKVEALVEALVDLCCLENVVIVCRSLCILRIVLNHLVCMETKTKQRDNVMVERPTSGNNSSEINGSNSTENRSLFHRNAGDTSDAVSKLFNPTLSMTRVDWVSLFQLMQQITMRNHEELVRFEAVSIMNMILMRSNAYVEREKYGQGSVLQSVSQLLRKEAGFGVQKQAVHLVYLLVNCPKVMSMFCSGYKEGKNTGAANSNASNASGFQHFSEILDSLADCIACSGNGTQGLQLQRNTINLLAFLASSGKSGFEILLSHKLSERTNFFALILQMLASETDVEASVSVQPAEIFKERTLLLREALIFLNRLVSNTQYSGPVLRVLTNSRDVAFLTTDIANRLSRKGKWLWQPDTMTRQMRELEIVDLARVFKRKVYNFLGDNIP